MLELSRAAREVRGAVEDRLREGLELLRLVKGWRGKVDSLVHGREYDRFEWGNVISSYTLEVRSPFPLPLSFPFRRS